MRLATPLTGPVEEIVALAPVVPVVVIEGVADAVPLAGRSCEAGFRR